MRRKNNETDSMTKMQINNQLIIALDNNQMHYEIENAIIKTKKERKQEKEEDQL